MALSLKKIEKGSKYRGHPVVSCVWWNSQPEVGAGAFFALLRSRARSQKKSAKARRKKSAKKSKSAERERKKAQICAFSSPHSENPASEPKAARQG